MEAIFPKTAFKISKSGYFLGFSKKFSDEHTYYFNIKSPPRVLTDSEYHYWKTIGKVLYTGCPKKVTEFQIEMAANIWPRKSDHFFLKAEILRYLAGYKAFKAKLAFSH